MARPPLSGVQLGFGDVVLTWRTEWERTMRIKARFDAAEGSAGSFEVRELFVPVAAFYRARLYGEGPTSCLVHVPIDEAMGVHRFFVVRNLEPPACLTFAAGISRFVLATERVWRSLQKRLA